MIKQLIPDFVPHWFIWLIVVGIFGFVHFLMVMGSISNTVLETNVQCKVTNIIASSESKIYLNLNCNDIVDSIGGSELILKWFETKKDFRCTTYANKSVGQCVLEE